MRSHIDPLDSDTFVIQSERDVRDMIEAYLGWLVHFLFPLSTPPITPHNTVALDRRGSINRGEVLLKRFKLGSAPERVATSLQQVREQFLLWLTGTSEALGSYDRTVWMGCHLWLERRFATGFRLLFFEGQNWQPTDAALSAAQVVYGWPSTLSRLVFQRYPTSENPFLNGRSPTSFYTAICAFDNQQEKDDFETASGLRDDQYIYLWSGTAPGERCDFNDELLVWFRNAGLLTENQRLPDQPLEVLGNSIEKQKRWELLRRETFNPDDDDLDDYFEDKKNTFKDLLRHASRELSESSLAFKRSEATLKKILGKDDLSSDDCFWSLQSVMFYDWKYYYLFPFSYERQQFAGLALSAAKPILQSHLRLIALFTSRMLEVFAETEDWARNRLRHQKASNLLRASERISDAWANREPTQNNLGSHKPFFRKLLAIVFEDGSAGSISSDHFLGNASPEEHHLEPGRKDERPNILYAAVNYWSSFLPDRVFAEWLSPNLGESRQEIWDTTWDVYRSITNAARDQFQYHTFNDFLFERAPRKSTIEWRWHERQVIPRSYENPSSWASEPPSMTRDVERILFANIEISTSEIKAGVRNCIDQLQINIASIASLCREELKSYIHELAHFRKVSLGIFDGDLRCLQQTLKELDCEVSKQGEAINGRKQLAKSQAAEYLIRLALYLNVQMNTTKGADADSNTFLSLPRCAFMGWALNNYYRPDTFSPELQAKAQDGDEVYSHFYSIPVHVSAADEADISRSSILSLGTFQSLTPNELILLRDIGKEIVLPSMMIDQREEIRVHEREKLRAGMAVGLYHQLGQVVKTVRSRVGALIDEGDRLQNKMKELEKSQTFDRVIRSAISKWEGHRDYSIKRMERLQMFRNFAFGQLTGAIENPAYASAKSVAEEALQLAQEYLLDDFPLGIDIKFGGTLGKHQVNEDAYGFILQEIIANACRGASGPTPWVQIEINEEEGKAYIDVTNSLSREKYIKLLGDKPDPSQEPGPEKQSGRGLFGVYCLFQARNVHAPEAIGPHHKDGVYWFGFRCPIIDFYSVSSHR
jgi:hypothetical protein